MRVCLDAKELAFDGPLAERMYALYDDFSERQAAVEALRKAIERPQVEIR